MRYKRIFLVILDSLGIGATHDADKYGDGVANTFKHVLENSKVEFPNLKALGLFELLDENKEKIYGYYTKAAPSSVLKSSLISHLEMMDVEFDKNFKKFDFEKLDKDLLNLIHTEIDRKLIFAPDDDEQNVVNTFGSLHIKTGDIIIEYNNYNVKLYAHESLVPMKELIKIAGSIMEILFENDFLVNKIITVNFKGQPGGFIINKNKGYVPMPRPNSSILEKLKKIGYKIITIGKATELFNQFEMTNICNTTNDIDTIKKLIKSTSFNFKGICVTNLSDLNKAGHNRDVESYIKILKGFDNSVPLIVGSMHPDDLLIITSDQGNDPTYTGNDHTREKVPVLVFNTGFKESGELPYLQSLSDIGATIADNFGINDIKNGKSFLERLK